MSITLIIIIVTVGVSVLALANKEIFYKLMYTPYLVLHRKQWYRIVSHSLIHADWMHLLVNMYVLYLFGKVAEAYYQLYFGTKGTFFFLLLYIGGVLFASLPALGKHKNNPHYNSVGASGAVSAVLFASILFIPTQSIRFFFIPIDIPAFIFGILYIVFEVYMDKRSKDRVAHDAHYWGALFGVAFTIVLKPAIALNFIAQILG